MFSSPRLTLLLLLGALAATIAKGQPHDAFRLTEDVRQHTVDPSLVSVESIEIGDRGTDFTLANHTSSPVQAIVLVFRRLDLSGKQVSDGRILYDVLTTPGFSRPIVAGGKEVYNIGTPPLSRVQGQGEIQPFLTAVVFANGRTSGSDESIKWIFGQRRVYRESWAEMMTILKAHDRTSTERQSLVTELQNARARRLKVEQDPYVEGFIDVAFKDCIDNLTGDLTGDQYSRRVEYLLRRYTEGTARLDVSPHP